MIKVGIAALIFSLFFFILIKPSSLLFVDAGRNADVARNLIKEGSFVTQFSISPKLMTDPGGWIDNLPPIHILTISGLFLLFGVQDSSVIYESCIFFIAGAFLVYLLAKKVSDEKTAFFASLFYLFTPELYNYAKDGAAEPLFIFELLLGIYLVHIKSKWKYLAISGVALLMLFSRLQAYVTVPLLLLWVIILEGVDIKKILQMVIIPVVGLILNGVGLLFGHYHFPLPFYLLFQQSSLYPGDNLPRSGKIPSLTLKDYLADIKVIFSKFFYNLYNFYKVLFSFDRSLPTFSSPLILVSFWLSWLGFNKESKAYKVFLVMTLVYLIGILILSAFTSPEVRYLHFVLPLVIISAIHFINNKSSKALWLIFILFFGINFIGTQVLDRRFSSTLYNFNKPHINVLIGKAIGSESQIGDLVVTNVDTWGSWYGDRKTMLIPVTTNALSSFDLQSPVQKIILTDFQRDNADHPLEEDWNDMFYANKIDNQYLATHFAFTKVATISADQNYERENITYKVWTRR